MDLKLKSVRAGHKGAVTTLLVKFGELKSKTDTEVDEVEALDDAVTQKQKTLIDLNNRLLDQTSEENLEQEITDSDEYMYQLDCKIRQIRKFIKSFETNNKTSHDNNDPSTSRLKPDALNFTPEARVDMNTCAIDSMNQQYSIHAPAGSAAQTVEGFALTNGNYETAVNLLRDRFGQPSKLIHAYMRALMNIPAPTNDVYSLRFYGDKLESCMRGLESLGQTPEMYGSLLAPVVLDKLPIDIRKSIAREHGRDNLILENLRKSITKEIDILEAGEGVTDSDRLYATAFFMGTQSHSQKSKFSDTRKKVHTRTCIFCSGEHYPTECTNVTQRNQIVKQKQLCFNCLGSHRVAACQSTKRCKNCNGMHHTSICKDKEVIPGTKPEPTIQQSAINEVETPNETRVMYSSHQSNDFLLKTATAPVTCNILFDEGAQRSFITQKLADKLEIKPTEKVSIQLSAFGDLSQKVRNLDTATIQLQTDTGENVDINTLIVPEIAVPIHNRPINRNINQPPTSTVVVNDISIKNTAIDNEKGKSTAKLPWEHDHPDDIPSGMTVAKRRPENTSQWLVQSRSHMNPFEENLQGSNLLPRPPERTHPQLVESRSHIDSGQELITHKENYRLVKLPCDHIIGCRIEKYKGSSSNGEGCPIGTFYDAAENCKECSIGFYGKNCYAECICRDNERCDNKHGCVEPTTTHRFSTISKGKEDEDNVIFYIGGVGLLVIGFLIGMLLGLKNKCCYRKRASEEKDDEIIQYPAGEPIEMDSYEYIDEQHMTDQNQFTVPPSLPALRKCVQHLHNEASNNDYTYSIDVQKGNRMEDEGDLNPYEPIQEANIYRREYKVIGAAIKTNKQADECLHPNNSLLKNGFSEGHEYKNLRNKISKPELNSSDSNEFQSLV
ncbi:unnamed protein product [Mytilus coruscus]|uniref:DUF1758 domain-containing protein n=1 Tax=Mytilus coruscus TaxID=42192 RepID=A0A6J8AFJ6_MYTCO|nr:unnamed protein product [Mytilus coruscus]